MSAIFYGVDTADIVVRDKTFRGVPFIMSYSTEALNSVDNVWTRTRVEITNLLDEWPYAIDRPYLIVRQELERWLSANCNGNFYLPPQPSFESEHYQIHINSVFFKDEDDAMAFKLRWL